MPPVGLTTHFFDTQLVNFLYFFGSWPKPNESYLKRGIFYGKIFLALTYLYCGYYSGIFVDNLYIRSNLVSLSIHGTLVIIRVFNFNVSWKGIRSSLAELQSFALEDEDERLFIKAKMPTITFLSAAFFFSHYFWVLGSVAATLFMPERHLPLHMIFPFDWQHNLFFYVLGYIYEVLGLTILASMNALTSIFVCYVMLMLSLQLDLLGKRIRKIGYTKVLKHKQIMNTDALMNYIKMHKKFDKLIQGSFTQETVRYVNCLYELCVSILHILLPLYFGNEMILKMRSLSFALYESNWVEQSQEFRKVMVIFSENLKKPHLISVAHVVPWNLETFTAILKLAYSMFNVLQSLEY